MPLEPGSKLGQYEILSRLGAGGMGEVYRAKDLKLGCDVAVKLLLEEVSTDAERLARLEREVRVLASLNHPNIAWPSRGRPTAPWIRTSWSETWRAELRAAIFSPDPPW
jgi:serine/threonine protein kinase